MTVHLEDILVALSASVFWAVSSTINKSLSRTVGSLAMNTVRLWSGFAIIVAIVLTFEQYDNIYKQSTYTLILLVGSGIVALSIGDTIFIKSLSFIYVSRAFPVGQCTFLILTVVMASLFLNETFNLLNIAGGCLILTGLYLVAVHGDQFKIPSLRTANIRGLLLAFMAALAWTAGAVILKLGLLEINAVFAAAIRNFAAATALTVFQCGSNAERNFSILRTAKTTTLCLTILSGVLGYGLSGLAYVVSVQRIGAGRTVLITSLTPVFVLILSILFLKEKATLKLLIGTIVCVIGIMCLRV